MRLGLIRLDLIQLDSTRLSYITSDSIQLDEV